ncbi:MAG TPA: endonuclease/exonuclease/phosphatase family protein [Polyangiaceae bacterium]|nr:endonuclease/exonuclease/phosphatase family protein [Polyangiaceae bacterium]
MRVATFNVWFDPFENEMRCRAVLDILERESPDVIALEEVTQPFLEALLETSWIRSHYAVSRLWLDPTVRYDVVMLSRLPARFTAHALTSQMGRMLHTLELETTEGCIAVAGVHLESMKEMTPVRLTQIDECLPVLCRAPTAIWIGDFNAAPDSQEDARIRAAFRDAWAELLADPGYTRDTTHNAMLARIKEDRHQRIDRIFLKSDHFRPLSIRMLGTEPIEGTAGRVFPSDHFGLVAELARCADRAAE